MKEYKLSSFEIEDMEDVLGEFEKDFNIKFDNINLEKIQDFDQFCDAIISEIDLENNEKCTFQRVFYTFRKAVQEVGIAKEVNIRPDTNLSSIFPWKNRWRHVKLLEQKMGFKWDLFQIHPRIIAVLYLGILFSIILLFNNFWFGILGVIVFFVCGYLSTFFKRMNSTTVRELIEKISAKHYCLLQIPKNTVNRAELKTIIAIWFSEKTGIEIDKLKKSSFVN